MTHRNDCDEIQSSYAIKSPSKLRAAIRLRATLGNFLLQQNLCVFTVTFGEKVQTLAKSRPRLLSAWLWHLNFSTSYCNTFLN